MSALNIKGSFMNKTNSRLITWKSGPGLAKAEVTGAPPHSRVPGLPSRLPSRGKPGEATSGEGRRPARCRPGAAPESCSLLLQQERNAILFTVYQIVQFRNRAGSVNIIPLNVSDTRNFRYNWMCCHRFYRLKGQVAQPDHHHGKRLRLKSVPSYVRDQLRRSWGAPQHTGLRRHADARGDTGLTSPVGVKSVVLSRTR